MTPEINPQDKPQPRIIFIDDDIDSKSYSEVVKKLVEFENISHEPIFAHISSFGGSVYDMLGIIDVLEAAISPIITICSGKAMSAAVPILACGTPGMRKMGKYATVMLHEVASFGYGKLYELKNNVVETERLQDLYLEIMAKFTKMPKSKFKKIFDSHKDTFLTAVEAKKIGIIDIIF